MSIMMRYSRTSHEVGSQSRGVAAEAGRWVWAEASRRIVATVCMTVSVIALAAVLPASADPNLLPASWWNPEWAFCVPLEVDVGPWQRKDAPVEPFINFTGLLSQAGYAGTVIADSLRVFEVDPNLLGDALRHGALTAVPCQYDPFTKDSGTLVFLLSGTTPPNTHRHYQLYFDVVGTFEPEQIQPLVELTDDIPDEGMATSD